MGSPGHARIQEELIGRIRAIPGVDLVIHEFPVVVPVVESCHLDIPAGEFQGRHSLFPIYPDLARLKTTPATGISGSLLYVGEARIQDLPATSLRGNIAVMEMSAYTRWQAPFSLGAAAVLLLGGPQDAWAEPAQQALYKPRYYVPEGPLADALRHRAVEAATVTCRASWHQVTARNLLATVRPAVEKAESPLEAIAVAVPYDAASIVLGQAPGGDNALDVAILLDWLRESAQTPSARPLLFAFIDAYTINQRGMRELFQLLTATADNPTRRIYEELSLEKLTEYKALAGQVGQFEDAASALEAVNNKRDYGELQRCVKDEVGPEIIRLRDQIGDLRLECNRDDPPPTPERRRELRDKEERMAYLNALLTRILTREPLAADDAEPAKEIWRGVRHRVAEQLQAVEQEAALFNELDTIRSQLRSGLGLPEKEGSVISFVLGLDISDSAAKCGPMFACSHLETTGTADAREFMRWLKPMVREGGALSDPALLRRAVATDAISGGESASSFNPGGGACLTSAAASFGIPAVTWGTVDSIKPRLDTPQDRIDSISWARAGPQVDFTRSLFNLLCEDRSFAVEDGKPDTQRSRWTCPAGVIISESLAETVPRTPEPDMLVTSILGNRNWSGLTAARGVRRNEFVVTRADGSFRFPATSGSVGRNRRHGLVQAFYLDRDGRIIKAISDSTSMLAGRISAAINLSAKAPPPPVRAVVFECHELDGPRFYDPRFLEPLNQFSLVDVRRGGTPKRSHFSIHDGQMFGLLPPDTRWQLILRAGSAAKRMVLMNISGELSEGETLRDALLNGFGLNEPLPSLPAHISARDFNAVDKWRREKYARAGIVSKSVDDLLNKTAGLIEEADQALAEDDGPDLQRAAATALANEIRAYEALLATAKDVTRGAVFLMLLLVPFSIAMERLILAFPGIYARIAGAIAIFVTMSTILWSFHPAFRITSQPLVILMAFAILLLSLAVIVMIVRKFEADLDELRGGMAEASGAETARRGVIGSAVWLGIANMRKRKLRTTLTAVTIVLITFAILCFTSSSTYRTKRVIALDDVQPAYPGVLIRLPGMQPMTPRAVEVVENLLQGRGLLSARYWWTDRDPNWRLHAINAQTGEQVSLKAALGLGPNEKAMLPTPDTLPNWNRFADGDGCYLSSSNAERLGLEIGETVTLAGRQFMLLGTFPAGNIENDWVMLDGSPMLPFDFTIESEQHASQSALESQLASGEVLQEEKSRACVSSDDVIIVPAEFLAPHGQLRSMAIRTADQQEAQKLAESLMEVLAFPMYCTAPSGVKAMVATPLIAKPPRNLAVPLIISALIIFNTMLNSVSERKKEIHIYTSLGLAPHHVGFLFVAEAATYGLLGSISGYVLGQGAATVLTNLELMGGVTLNYSGSSVIMTMTIVLTVVLLSAIVPAIMASRLATPSKDMNWHVPDPVDGVINDVLPFTVTSQAARGLIVFIHEFLDAHREGTIGNFAADHLTTLPRNSQRLAGLKATVWLAPYDLGVRQSCEMSIHPESEDICSIRINLRHETGQMRTWWRLNKPFLSDIRKQLLGWRRVPVERIIEYINRNAGR